MTSYPSALVHFAVRSASLPSPRASKRTCQAVGGGMVAFRFKSMLSFFRPKRRRRVRISYRDP